MAKFKPYFEVDLPRDYKPAERKAIAAEIIDEIISRTENGIDADGKKFVGYSKAYAKEKGQKNVDLTFSGEMLAEIQLLMEKSGKIRIGFDSGYEGLGKVEGNILGTYGNDKPVTKGRNFLGLTKEELDNILKNYPLEDDEERKERVSEVNAADVVARNVASRANVKNNRPVDDEDNE